MNYPSTETNIEIEQKDRLKTLKEQPESKAVKGVKEQSSKICEVIESSIAVH